MAYTELEKARALAWLATAEGAALLADATGMPADRLTRLTRLRRFVPADVAVTAVELLELRQRARSKFQDACRMYFTPEGLEQATGDVIASYQAMRFPPGGGILDACCGIGGDARWLAARGTVLAVDRSPVSALCTRLNARKAVPDAFPRRALCADVTRLSLRRLQDRGIQSAFFDPSRRGDRDTGGRRRVRAGEDYTPPLHWLETLRPHFENVGVKVSPAIDDRSLQYNDVRVEFLSDRGECKEAMMWFGSCASPLSLPARAAEPYFATLLRPGGPPATLAPFPCPPIEVAAPGAYLYEPDPAVIRAHLVPQLAAMLEGSLIEPEIAYLTADKYTATPFAAAFRVLDALPYHVKQVQQRLRALSARVVAVKKRGVPFEPAEVQKALMPCGDLPIVLVLTRRNGKVFSLLCERV